MTDQNCKADPDVGSVPRALSCGSRPPLEPSFGTRGAVLAAFSTFSKTKKKLLEIIQVTILLQTFPPLMIFLVSQKRKRPPKPLLGCQNWVTKLGGRHNLVSGLLGTFAMWSHIIIYKNIYHLF